MSLLPKPEAVLRSIEAELASRGLTLRAPTLDDLPALGRLESEAFAGRRQDRWTDDLTLLRLVEYGNSVVLHDASGEILGYHLVLITSRGKERTAVSLYVAIRCNAKGLDLGRRIYHHSISRAMLAGATVLRGTVAPNNFPSLALLLNKVGSVCDHFHPALGVSRIHRFRFRRELSDRSPISSPIDQGKLVELARNSRAGVDYQLMDPDDPEAIARTYAETEMRVMAVVKPGLLAEGTVLFALPRRAFATLRPQLERGDPW